MRKREKREPVEYTKLYMIGRILLFVFVLVAVLPIAIHAQSVSEYLSDASDSAVRLEVELPPELVPEESSLWSRLKKYIGVRSQGRVKPSIGTQFTVNSSAYAPSPYQTDSTPCVTAAGTRVRPGVVASNFLPLGTILDINGETFIVEDRMNPRYDGYFIDLWFPSTSSALEFGRKKLNATIIGYGSPGDNVRGELSQQEDEVEFEDPTLWDTVKNSIALLTSTIAARKPGDVNQYDVNCF